MMGTELARKDGDLKSGRLPNVCTPINMTIILAHQTTPVQGSSLFSVRSYILEVYVEKIIVGEEF